MGKDTPMSDAMNRRSLLARGAAAGFALAAGNGGAATSIPNIPQNHLSSLMH